MSLSPLNGAGKVFLVWIVCQFGVFWVLASVLGGARPVSLYLTLTVPATLGMLLAQLWAARSRRS